MWWGNNIGAKGGAGRDQFTSNWGDSLVDVSQGIIVHACLAFAQCFVWHWRASSVIVIIYRTPTVPLPESPHAAHHHTRMDATPA